MIQQAPVLLDEFKNGIDPTIWKIWGVEHDTYVGFDRGVIRGSEVTYKDGNMIISMTKRDKPKTFQGSPNVARSWNVGWVSLQPKHGFVYGAYEVEAIIPAAKDVSAGVWGGIWSRPYNGKIGGEIDVAESFGHGGTLAKHSRAEGYTATVHFDQTGKNNKGALSPKAAHPISKTYNKYGVVKTSKEIIFYFNRKEFFRVNRSENPEAFDKAFPPNEPFDIRFCIQAGGQWGGYPNLNTAQRSELKIRKVTLWKF